MHGRGDPLIEPRRGPTLLVTGGQDHGARLLVERPDVEVGRGPRSDLMLTDPAVAEAHLRIRRAGEDLMVEDLVGDARVNGRPLPYPSRVRPGDRIALAGTELTLLPPAPDPATRVAPPPPPPAVPPPPPHDDALPRAELARTGLALVALALAAATLLGPFVPIAEDAGGATSTIWMLRPVGLLAQSAATGWLATVGALLAAFAARPGASQTLRAIVPPALALTGGLAAGLPLALIALRPGGSPTPGALALLVTGAALATCGVGLALLGEPRPARDAPAGARRLAVALGAGALALVLSGPLPWVAGGGVTFRGTDAALRVGWGAIACGLVLALGTLALLSGLRAGPRQAAAGAAAALGAAGASLGFALAAASWLGPLDARLGLVLALTAALAATGIAGVACGRLSWIAAGPPPDDSGQEAWPTTS